MARELRSKLNWTSIKLELLCASDELNKTSERGARNPSINLFRTRENFLLPLGRSFVLLRVLSEEPEEKLSIADKVKWEREDEDFQS